MARNPFRKRRTVSPGTPGAKDISSQIQELTAAVRAVQGEQPLRRPDEWVTAAFPPGHPLGPQPLDQIRPDTKLPDPRLWQYPVTINLPGVGDKTVSWDTLKTAAETPVFRNCIEIRKSAISALDWTVRPSPKFITRESQLTGQAKNQIERGIREKYRDEIQRGIDFWEYPDRKNGLDFAAWISLLLEEHLTWDAMAVYPHKTYGGDLLGLWIIDGSTIKPLWDQTGGRPEPPAPAYQQLLYGFPRGEFTADTVTIDGKLVVPGALTASQLVYERKVRRTYSPYGFSPTEQALLDGLLWNKRFQWILSEYTEGTTPVTWLLNKGTSDWTPKQTLEYERAFNDRHAGQISERMRNPLLPPGIEPAPGQQIPERYRPDYDLFILKLVLSHFDVDISEYGFTEAGGLGSAGYHEGKADIQFRRATLPTSKWLGKFCTRLQTGQLGLPPELEFSFLGLESEDEAAADAIAENRVRSGRMTLNEDRARQGLPPYEFEEANMALLETQRGMVQIEGFSKLVPAGVMYEPASEHPNVQGGNLDSKNAPVAGPAEPVTKNAGAEVLTFRRWCAKRPGGPARKFKFEYLTESLAKHVAPDLLTDSRVEFAKAGDAGPKDGISPDGNATLNWSPYSVPSL